MVQASTKPGQSLGLTNIMKHLKVPQLWRLHWVNLQHDHICSHQKSQKLIQKMPLIYSTRLSDPR